MGPSVGRQTRLVFFCSRDLPFFFCIQASV